MASLDSNPTHRAECSSPRAHKHPFARCLQFVSPTLLLGLLLSLDTPCTLVASTVSKWEVFETEFRSTRTYGNPCQEVRLNVNFVSPAGHTNRVHGFWRGGTQWAVRFSPDELGPWRYTTDCSDARNSGLHHQSGTFLCTVQSLRTDLQQHGRICVSRDGRTFQHADGTPFFWTADTVWEGPRKSTRKEWIDYIQARSRQGYNVALWRVAPGTDARGRAAFRGTDPVQLHPGMLEALDERIAWLASSDLVSAIAPLWEIGVSDEDLLPEDQVIMLLRQLVGRWDARPVAWVIAFDADTAGRRAARWRRIGRSVFDGATHAPVIVYAAPHTGRSRNSRASRG